MTRIELAVIILKSLLQRPPSASFLRQVLCADRQLATQSVGRVGSSSIGSGSSWMERARAFLEIGTRALRPAAGQGRGAWQGRVRAKQGKGTPKEYGSLSVVDRCGRGARSSVWPRFASFSMSWLSSLAIGGWGWRWRWCWLVSGLARPGLPLDKVVGWRLLADVWSEKCT
ncbi:uncharacterized protein BKA78DRAFT_85755 [Phyllosticta capitalensis]|uniref:uncharacterized protein n=1 Tax=Phyllosticta capitalensis TaxID=121624 RepID=UPI00312E684A